MCASVLIPSFSLIRPVGGGCFVGPTYLRLWKKPISTPLMGRKGKESSSSNLLSTSAATTITTKSKKKQAEDEADADANLPLQAMTVQQLRTMSKNLGIPTRGSKRDLVSALNCFLAKEKDGQISPVTPAHISSLETKPIDPENIPSGRKLNEHVFMAHKGVHRSTESKRRTKTLSDGPNSNPVSEVSRSQQKKRKCEPLSVDGGDNSLEVNLSNQVIEKKSSILQNLISDTKLSSARRKSVYSLGNEDSQSTGRVALLGDSSEPWTILAHMKPQKEWVPYNPRTMRPAPLVDGTKSVKLISWNVNGLRALLKLEGFRTFAQRENFDVLCLQETKLQEKDVEKIKQCLIDGYENSFWTCSVSKLGYSGSAIISRIKPLSVRYGLGILDHDSEGRLVTAEFDTFYLISGYVPNSGDGLKRLEYRVTQWDPSLGDYVKELEKLKPVILTGDLNCAHEEIDIFNPAGNRRNAGFTDEERESFETNFLSRGFVDTFRRQHPGVVGYTYWGYRHNTRISNKGWRLDYFLVSESIANRVHDSYILPDITGSDHCPIALILKL